MGWSRANGKLQMASIQGAEKDGAKKQENGMRRRMLA